MYVEFVVSLNMATFLASLARAVEYVDGVPQVILFDSAKTVVSERVGTVVRFNEDLMNFALHAGFTPRACWVNDPESKGKVESAVKYVKKGFFYALEWTGIGTSCLWPSLRGWSPTGGTRIGLRWLIRACHAPGT